MKTNELEWRWVYVPYLDMPEMQAESALKAGYAKVYYKSEVDSLITEKDKAIAELKQKLEDAKATAYAESVDAGMENRRLKRALWLARAWRARNQYQMFCFSDHIGDLMNVNGFIQRIKGCCNMRNAREWQKIWENVERKCRAKAEEYK